MSEEDGARLLGPLRTMDVPASDGVSVQRAIRSGKRTKTLRVAAAGVFVLIIAGVLPVLVKPTQNHVAAEPFDPLVRTISVSATDGLKPVNYIIGRDVQVIYLRPVGNGDQQGSVNVFAAGSFREPSGEPLPDVNGKRAMWTGNAVAVEWSPRAWAVVSVEGFPDDRDRAQRLAETLRFDEHVAIKIPYTVQTSWKLNRVFDDGGDIQLEFENGVRLALRGGVGFAQGEAPRTEMEALEKSLRRADPPVTNPFR
ncbi:hypothetical protein SK803_20095 [Lentzea sp. BCCO 10_0856]|uniref:Lipopolysaccharide export system protein LptC n=1 Tax=Lentzea miocenica TaxID=3095431 RepID=A0ABU4T2Z4_9PSEU|nr:hypothetical protein [Lentzea sp. BCCO 10_0856]MDX8032521.1 hypothetical protein [Lentzea sp. BCCO 10_0856]